VVNFPNDYELSPSSGGYLTTNLQSVGACSLYEVEYMHETSPSSSDLLFTNGITCQSNYLHSTLGNSVEFVAPKKSATVDDAQLQMYNGTDVFDYMEYKLTLSVNNADSGSRRTDVKSWDLMYDDVWSIYKYYSRKFTVAAFANAITDCVGQACTRSYGVLDPSWVGF
jgi:hypothetical protein